MKRTNSPAALQTPEFAFVVACSRWPLDAGAIEAARDLAGRVGDWDRVVAIVDRHRVAGLVNNAVGAAQVALPAPARAALGDRARENAIRELSFAAETLRIVRLLEAAEITTTVIKGAASALVIFGRFGVRSSVDIDLLVAKADVPRASAIIAAAGYGRTEPPQHAPPAELRARMARHKDLVFEHATSEAVIELHWRLFQNPFFLRDRDVAGRCPLTLLGEERVTTLAREALLLYLCAHGAEHGWMRLKWLADVAVLLAAEATAADRLYTSARANGMQRVVGPGLLLAHALFGTPLPDRLAEDVRGDWRMRALHGIARASLIGDEDGAELEARPLATARKNLGHYLLSNDPRFWMHEMRFDLLDAAKSDSGGEGPRFMVRVGRVARLMRRRPATR